MARRALSGVEIITRTAQTISGGTLEKRVPLKDRGDQSRSQAGIGLGLSLASAIARAHGGDITVTSTPGEGSAFTVILPMSGT